MVRRIYVEKKPGLRQEAESLFRELRDALGIRDLTDIRVLNRYDVDGLEKDIFDQAARMVFSEPQADNIYYPEDEKNIFYDDNISAVFAVESLPGQFDQRADSARACIQLLTRGERPLVRTAKVYLLSGKISPEDISRIKLYFMNPVESREAALERPETLKQSWKQPDMVKTITGFLEFDERELSELLSTMGLAMGLDDLIFLRDWFREHEKRDPTVTEIRVIDTYWSDHCRHTTFSTRIDAVEIDGDALKNAYERYLSVREEAYGKENKNRPQTLMDIATIGAKILKKRGVLKNLDESEEINACSARIKPVIDGKEQDWLLMFKNETHNHPTEIEPFGGAATCIGGCIRDPLSGRAYVYHAMRISGCGDPRTPIEKTLPGKLPQRKLAQTSAAGYSSYGNQIGLATGLVCEIYHPGYIAKHLELGAVVGAVPAANVIRKRPEPGDIIILLGGRTGRDGIGGATGSSKSHDRKSLSTMASEVQKGNAPEERKIQRLFRDGGITRMIKRCNDFGAGGVSVAVGELAPGLEIDLDTVRKKYEGLDGTELAISESQERMAVVVSPENAEKFIQAAERENLEAYPVAKVTEKRRMEMNWQGKNIVSLSRDFLDSNGAVKHITIQSKNIEVDQKVAKFAVKRQNLRDVAGRLKSASGRGLAERFDSTIGAGTVLMPFGGNYQRTPAQVMAALIPVLPGQDTKSASVMTWGFYPPESDQPESGEEIYFRTRESVILSLAKLAAAGCDYQTAYLSFQEYFEKLGQEPERWGKPFAALLGALDAQLGLGVAAIGGKDSMSGSFMDLDVPPTLISFAIAPMKSADMILSPEFKKAGHSVYAFCAFASENDKNNLNYDNIKKSWDDFHALYERGIVKSAWAVENGVAEAVMKMSFGNQIGFRETDNSIRELYNTRDRFPGMIIAELSDDIDNIYNISGIKIGETTDDAHIQFDGERVSVAELLNLNERVLEDVYPNGVLNPPEPESVPVIDASPVPVSAPKIHVNQPRVFIPVFPGSNCEYDSARAVINAGLSAEIFVIRNQTANQVSESSVKFAEEIQKSQIIFIPGGFSGGDEPDGSGKFITAFFRNPRVSDAVRELLKQRDGLILGVCNGFQALIKLGLTPYGDIINPDETFPTLSYNTIGRHQSKIVRTRVASVNSPWLTRVRTGEIISVPVSHGEGRFICPDSDFLEKLRENGQIATQYADLDGNPTMDINFNPNGSTWAVEGLLSPDGRIFGKMGHSERVGPALYRNVPGNYNMYLFESAKDYFSL